MDPDVTNIQQPFFNFLLLLTHFDATYTHSHTLSLSLSHTQTHTHSVSLSLSLTHTHTQPITAIRLSDGCLMELFPLSFNG